MKEKTNRFSRRTLQAALAATAAFACLMMFACSDGQGETSQQPASQDAQQEQPSDTAQQQGLADEAAQRLNEEAAAPDGAGQQAAEEAAAQEAAEQQAAEEAAAQEAAEEEQDTFDSQNSEAGQEFAVLDPYYEGTWEVFGVLQVDAAGNQTTYDASGTVDCHGSIVKADVDTDNGAIVFSSLLMAADENPQDGEGYNVLASDWDEYPTVLYGWGSSEFGTIILLDSLDPETVENQLVLYFN